MANVCFYFQFHQPKRLRRYTVFDTEPNYFDDYHNELILRKVADKCYLPATALLLKLVKQHGQAFRFGMSLTGLVVEQFQKYCPQVIDQLKALADTGCVELLGETYFHSLAWLYSPGEFHDQIDQHTAAMRDTFGQTPTVFRNTELIYSNDMARFIHELGRFKGALCEGADQVLNGRSPSKVYTPPGLNKFKLLLKNYQLSDDIAFRFSNRQWDNWPLTTEKFVAALDRIQDGDALCNLFMDFETFGEHQWQQTGIFDFLRALPAKVLEGGKHRFLTPGQCIDLFPATDEYDVPDAISWADTERDLSAWVGNAMQTNALQELFALETPIKTSGDADLIKDWQTLTTSDHFYYMCTKYFEDGAVHKYFNPYESPYDSYINFMNVMDNLRTRLGERS